MRESADPGARRAARPGSATPMLPACRATAHGPFRGAIECSRRSQAISSNMSTHSADPTRRAAIWARSRSRRSCDSAKRSRRGPRRSAVNRGQPRPGSPPSQAGPPRPPPGMSPPPGCAARPNPPGKPPTQPPGPPHQTTGPAQTPPPGGCSPDQLRRIQRSNSCTPGLFAAPDVQVNGKCCPAPGRAGGQRRLFEFNLPIRDTTADRPE